MRLTFTIAGLDVDADTSVNCTPLVPCRRQTVDPFAVDRDRLGADQLAGVFPGHPFRRVADDVDAAVRRGEHCGIDAKRRGDLRARARRAPCPSQAESPASHAAVVLPPEAPLNGYMVSPISALTALTGRPSVSAVPIATIVRVPVPISCVPHFITTPPSDMMSQCAREPRPPPPHRCAAQPMPVLIGPDCASPVGCRLSQPNAFAPSGSTLPTSRSPLFREGS